MRRLGGQGLGLDSHLQPTPPCEGLPAPALSGWVPPWRGAAGPRDRAHCVQGQQWVALVVGVDPRAPAVPGGTRPEWLPGRGVSQAGPGSGGLMWLTAPPSGSAGLPPPHPPAKGLHLLNGPCGYAAVWGRGLGAAGAAGAACLAREKSPPVNL